MVHDGYWVNQRVVYNCSDGYVVFGFNLCMVWWLKGDVFMEVEVERKLLLAGS